jgi:excisionase family DNA binding protein
LKGDFPEPIASNSIISSVSSVSTIAFVSIINYRLLEEIDGHGNGPLTTKEIEMAVLDETFVPSEIDIEKAKAFSRTLARQIAPESRVTIRREDDGQEIEIPRTVFNVLMKVLSVMSEGKPFTLIPMDEELTTQQAADILNVSRPYLNKVLDLDEIPHRKVGRNRRIKFGDLLEYKKKQERRSKDALQELVDQAQDLNMGY